MLPCISVMVGDGKRTLFWTDNWIDGCSVESMAPTMIRAVSKRVLKTQTVHQGRAYTMPIGSLRSLVAYLFLQLLNTCTFGTRFLRWS
jgi:hypothetical protein